MELNLLLVTLGVLFLGGLAACLPPLILSEIYRNVRQNQREGVMPLKASFFFFLTTLSAISCGFLAARLSFAGSGIELVAVRQDGQSETDASPGR